MDSVRVPRKIVQKSTALLAFKVILLELVIELIFIVMSSMLLSVSSQSETDIRVFTALFQVILIPIQVTALIILLLRWTSETYEFEGNEVVVRQGIFNKEERSYAYNNMQSVVVKQSIFDRILNAGTVSVYVPTLGRDLIFNEVPNPQSFAQTIKAAIPYSEKGQFILQR